MVGHWRWSVAEVVTETHPKSNTIYQCINQDLKGNSCQKSVFSNWHHLKVKTILVFIYVEQVNTNFKNSFKAEIIMRGLVTISQCIKSVFVWFIF